MLTRPVGRPVDPNSEASLRPWAELGISRATYYWRKRYNDLPVLTKAEEDQIRDLACELDGYGWVPLVALEYGVDEETIMGILR